MNDLTVCGIRYSVKRKQMPGWMDACAAIDLKDKTIVVDEGYDQDESLLHEVIHALDDAFSIELSERDTQALARGLWAVIRDNDWFSDYLRGAE